MDTAVDKKKEPKRKSYPNPNLGLRCKKDTRLNAETKQMAPQLRERHNVYAGLACWCR